jgi:hypothetical protein
MEYTFAPYDVLQIEADTEQQRSHGRQWLDVSTLRTALDGDTARAAVDSGRFLDRDARLRIVRPFDLGAPVVYVRRD